MKKIFLFLTLVLFSAGTMMAQIRKIPAEVTNAFKEKYPSATDVTWKDKLTSFRADFKDNGAKKIAWFTKEDGWKETETATDFDSLPEAVKDGFSKSKYNTDDWKKGSVAEIQTSDGAIQYRIFVEKNFVSKKFLYFDKNGQLQKDKIGI